MITLTSPPLAGPVRLPSPPYFCRKCGGDLDYLGPQVIGYGHGSGFLYMVQCEDCGWKWWLAPDGLEIPRPRTVAWKAESRPPAYWPHCDLSRRGRRCREEWVPVGSRCSQCHRTRLPPRG